ncbi:hypothetical protein J437_LFUL019079 [Ladona fulva]|uniref:TGF-beta family profile domain-containing protein n=1 Tax=Ladona fulva TaxID=123851 RepID=A0A8K0KPY2_LADFU|nr:hypothetical protein J437_LFUL019079 [Ladona fulva]
MMQIDLHLNDHSRYEFESEKHDTIKYISNKRVLHKTGSDKKPEFVPCCTATRLSPIQLMYMDDKRMISQKTLPNMAVEACGCM